MRKITKLMLTLALCLVGAGVVNATKLYATYGTPASDGSWNSETHVYSWTKEYNNLMTLFEFTNGELAKYKSLHLTIDNTGCRVCFMNGSTVLSTIVFGYASEKNIVFAEHSDTKNLDLSEVTAISFGGQTSSGSVTLTDVYLVKPTTVDFDESGVAMIGITDIDYDTNLTYNDQTGEMTSKGNGTFSVSLNNENFTSVTRVELLRSGDDIVQTLQIIDADNGVLNTWWGSKYNCDFTGYQANAGKITKLSWNCNAAGTMTITGIRITSSLITAAKAGEVVLNTLPWIMISNNTAATPDWNVNKLTDTFYGNYSGDPTHYVDLTAFSELRVYQETDAGFRAFFINSNGSGTNQINSSAATWHAEGKYWSLPLASIEKYNGMVALKAIKSVQSGVQTIVTNMTVYNQPAPSDPQYILSGSGALSSSAKAALADVNATYIDATGITKAIELTTANPNCLIVANDGKLTNAQNVIVNDVCANLVLADGYAFAAPSPFTATAAKYNTTINSTAGAGTLVLPFSANLPSGVTAFTLSYVSGDQADATEVSAITANEPVLLNGDGAAEFTAANVSIAATSGTPVKKGALNGVYESTEITSGYVMQNGIEGVGFYKVNAASPITVKPFRAYLTADAGARVSIVYGDSEMTGISNVESAAEREAVFSLSGVRVAQPQKGIYVKGGRKYIVK